MRKNRTCGSEGGEAKCLPDPYQTAPKLVLKRAYISRSRYYSSEICLRRRGSPALNWRGVHEK
jgi:hypothetical protein